MERINLAYENLIKKEKIEAKDVCDYIDNALNVSKSKLDEVMQKDGLAKKPTYSWYEVDRRKIYVQALEDLKYSLMVDGKWVE